MNKSFITAAPKFAQSNLLSLRGTGGLRCHLRYGRKLDEMGNWPGIVPVVHPDLRCLDPPICVWGDLGDAARALSGVVGPRSWRQRQVVVGPFLSTTWGVSAELKGSA